MSPFRPAAVVLLAPPFTGGTGAKRRPALVLLNAADIDIIVVPITSRNARTAFDVPLADWRWSGLYLPSTVRVNKPVTADQRMVELRLAVLSAQDWDLVCAKVHELCDPL